LVWAPKPSPREAPEQLPLVVPVKPAARRDRGRRRRSPFAGGRSRQRCPVTYGRTRHGPQLALPPDESTSSGRPLSTRLCSCCVVVPFAPIGLWTWRWFAGACSQKSGTWIVRSRAGICDAAGARRIVLSGAGGRGDLGGGELSRRWNESESGPRPTRHRLGSPGPHRRARHEPEANRAGRPTASL